MKTTYILIVAATIATAAHAANTWWVDDDWYGQGGNGSEERPFGTIQDAIDASATQSGDTIKVKAGVYNKGAISYSGGGATLNRVVIKKKVHLVAVDGRKNTFIVGAPHSASSEMGASATRCILYPNLTDGGTTIEGFTICGGCTADVNDYAGYGGALLDLSAGNRGISVIDCTISNCVANSGGVARYGRFYRCLITGNRASNRIAATHASQLHSCIVSHCSQPSSASDALCQGSTAVNCTFFANANKTGCTAYNCIFSGGATGEPTSATSTHSTNGYYQVIAPALGDYRPIEKSAAVGRGDPSKLLEVKIHDHNTRSTIADYNGVPYPASDSAFINAGAVQETATPAGGALQFVTSGAGFDVDGHFARSGDYVFPEAYPTQYQVKAAVPDGKYIFCYDRAASDGGRRHPQMDDTLWLMPPPDTARVSTNTAVFASVAYWVNPKDGVGDNDNSGTSESAPLKTLQAAIDKCDASTDTVIFAAEGDYREGGKIHATSHPLTNRVYFANNKYVFLRGAGVGKSFITGAVDPVTGGTGHGVIRPVGSMSGRCAVQGFTLRGAGAYDTSTGVGYMSAGAFCGSNSGTHFLDCAVTGCAGSAAVVYRCTVERCRIVGNTTLNYVLCGDNSPIMASIVANNTGGYATIAGATYSVNVTAAGPCGSTGVIHSGVPKAYASIFANGKWDDRCDDKDYVGFLSWNVSPAPTIGTYADALFSATNSADYRVLADSPAYTCGVAPTSANYGAEYWKYAGGDVDGNRLVFTDGKPLAGACHTPGVSNWYVDGVNGDDANTGESADAAKQSIGAVLSKGLPSGVTVHVAAGTYDSETPSCAGDSTTCRSRVVVPAGVTLEGAGADSTTIVGAAAEGGDDLGLGDSAVRCVYLESGATIRGFTLTGGRTAKIGAGTTAGKSDANNLGGGVLGVASEGCYVEDCVITGCNGWRAGAMAYAMLRRCRVQNCFGGDDEGNGSATYYGSLYSTVVDNCGAYAVMYPKAVEQSTIGAGNRETKKGRSLHLGNGNKCRLVNSLVLCDYYIDTATACQATNCYFAKVNSGDYSDWLGPNSVVTNAATLVVDANCMPVVGSNVAIDKADASLDKFDETTDAFGGQRVYNGALDVGAVEADWRGRYGKDIGGRGLSVTNASPEVEEVAATRNVRLAAGTSLSALWNNGLDKERRYTITLTLEADSVATVAFNGVTTTFDTAGTHSLDVVLAANSANTLAFACENGYASVLKSASLDGIMVIIR